MIRPDVQVRAAFAHSPVAVGLLDFMCGDFIGFGVSRAVYDCKLFPGCVVKVEYDNGWQNIQEWEVWKHVRETKLAKWFAPCVKISDCGKYLVMRKTRDLSKMPDKVPEFFTDIKFDNWGLYKGHPVCHDYGLNLLMEKGMSSRMRKAKQL